MAAYKHDFSRNLELIRGDAVYGGDVRLAIAEAIEQALSEATGDVGRRINNLSEHLTNVTTLVNSRELFVNLNPLGDDDFEMEIINAN